MFYEQEHEDFWLIAIYNTKKAQAYILCILNIS